PALVERAERPVYAAAAAIAFVPPPGAGILERLEGLEDARAVEGVVDVQQLVEDGTAIDGLASSYSRLAHVRTKAADPAAALAAGRAAAARIGVAVRVEAAA